MSPGVALVAAGVTALGALVPTAGGPWRGRAAAALTGAALPIGDSHTRTIDFFLMTWMVLSVWYGHISKKNQN